jgi:hypothetical protein
MFCPRVAIQSVTKCTLFPTAHGSRPALSSLSPVEILAFILTAIHRRLVLIPAALNSNLTLTYQFNLMLQLKSSVHLASKAISPIESPNERENNISYVATKPTIYCPNRYAWHLGCPTRGTVRRRYSGRNKYKVSESKVEEYTGGPPTL